MQPCDLTTRVRCAFRYVIFAMLVNCMVLVCNALTHRAITNGTDFETIELKGKTKVCGC